MAAYGGAADAREFYSLQPDRRSRGDSYEHGADGHRGDQQSTHDHRERRILAERHRPSAHHGHVRKSVGALRTRGPLALVDGRNPQDDAHAGAATRGASPGDGAEGTL